ncbi:MAG TPA: LacI family DNA-binding transcriptional regulator [Polyangiaceae bacterium]|jgi:DNA-binding LacI/PurR family transcriptional regulator|nr:LacI family DNA-binding transcriptional regulator [Polyangiaceae bacterium]
MKKRTTIADLAKLLGIDKSSISLALRDSPKMSLATRARVHRVAREQNYIPNWAAKQLAGSTSHAIGLVMPSAFACFSHPRVVHTIQALARLAAARGLTLNLIANEQLATSKDRPLLPLHADGLLVWGDVPAPSTTWFSSAYARPSIVLDPHHPTYARYEGSAIRIRNKEGASAVVRHLYERGARHLTFVQVVTEHLSHEERWRGTKQAWLEHASAATLRKLLMEELTDEDLKKLAARGKAAIFCSNDLGAMQVWHRLHRLGIRVPQDIKLAGFDGDEYGALVGLTTALFDSEALAQKAFSGLERLITKDTDKFGQESIPITLRIGTTS